MSKQILVVEDDFDLRMNMKDILEDAGFRVLTAGNGQTALEVLSEAEPLPNLILLDLMMPIMDGWEFREKQLADPAFKAIPVIALSASDVQLRPIEVTRLLPKPFVLDQLILIIQKHCT